MNACKMIHPVAIHGLHDTDSKNTSTIYVIILILESGQEMGYAVLIHSILLKLKNIIYI